MYHLWTLQYIGIFIESLNSAAWCQMATCKTNTTEKWIKILRKKLNYNKFIYAEHRVHWWSIIYVELMYKKVHWWRIKLYKANLHRNKLLWWHVTSVEFMYIKNKSNVESMYTDQRVHWWCVSYEEWTYLQT